MEITFAADRTLAVDDEAWGLLFKVGAAGLQEGFYLRARKIFEALLQLRPDEDLVAVGLALAHVATGTSADAIATIDRALARKCTSPILAVYAVRFRLMEGMAVQPEAMAVAQHAALANPLLAGILDSVHRRPQAIASSTMALERQL
jgi:thioredoxin-like negative regulator of GroEL